MKKFYGIFAIPGFFIILALSSCGSIPGTEQTAPFDEGGIMYTILPEHLFHNYTTIQYDDKGYARVSRFYPQQLEAYRDNAMFDAMSKSSSGVVLSFITTGDSINFKCRVPNRLKTFQPIMRQISVSSVVYALKKLSKDNIKKGVVLLDGIDLVVDGELHSTKYPISSNIKFRFDNPSHKKCEVKIFFPVIFDMYIKDLEINGVVERLQTKEHILCLGDSITQGFSAGNPSRNYVALLADKLNVDVINQGIGGYVYRSESLTGLENFKKQFGEPKFITVAYGTNDWYYKIPEKEFRENAADYYKHLTGIFPSTPIYIITPIWRGDTELDLQGKMPFENIANIIEQEASAFPSIKIIDGMKLVPHDFKYFSDVYLHPNAEAFSIMTNNLIKQAGFTVSYTAAGE
ncbi:MAG: SGNH/GDSL hydrolase family protein [Treponema sp.]|jgi:hypothetical protein|nr:SGNH/GDSL hydrolase family protein [Treponema sp.]